VSALIKIKIYSLALSFLMKSDTPKTNNLWVIIYQNLAQSYCNWGNKEKAIEFFEKALLLSKNVMKGEIDIQSIKKRYESCKVK